MNKAILIGRVGKDAETKKFESGAVKVSFTLATNEYRKGKDGERENVTEWHSVQMWGERAEKLSQHITKGKLLCVEGSISSGRYEEDGNVRYYPFVKAVNIEFLSSKNDGVSENPVVEQAVQQSDLQLESSDDLPF